MTIRVVIQQRDRLLRQGLSQLLGNEPGITVLGSAASDTAALTRCTEEKPDVAIFEVDATEWDPCRLATRLQRAVSGLKFVGTHSDSTDEVRLERMKRMGLTALVAHSNGSAGLAEAIRTVSARSAPRLGVVDLGLARPSRLTSRETAILRLIGAGYSCREVSTQLGISSKTVENHKQRIFRKLGVQNQSHAISIAFSGGLIDSIQDWAPVPDSVGTNSPNGERPSVRVIIADENTLQRDILAAICESRGIGVIARPGGTTDLLEECHRSRPNVVVASDQFGDEWLDELVPQILPLGIRLIVLSSSPSAERLTSLLGHGVHGFMSREATPDEVVTGILAVARGAASLDHTAAAMMLKQWRGLRSRLDSRVDLGLGVLTQREEDVLRAMIKGLATKAIARELGVAVKTVENHKIRVFEKLGARTQAQAVTVAISFGYGTKHDQPIAG